MNRFVAILAPVFALTVSAPALAHDPGLSSVAVKRVEDTVTAKLTFAWSDLAPRASLGTGAERPAADALATLGSRLARRGDNIVRIYANDILLPAAEPVVSTGTASSSEVIVSLVWTRVPRASIRLEVPLLAEMPFGHRMLVTTDESADAVALLDARHSGWNLLFASSGAASAETATAQSARAPWASFLPLGVQHILTGFDHLCFLAALLLATVRLREVLAVVTMFTLAHSLTLAAAAMGLVSLSPRIVEPLIAASIVYIGVENLFLREAPRHRLVLVFGFGLVHGLGFATALAERLPGVVGLAVVPPLLGFNAGVELGQLAVAGCLVPLIRFLRARPAIAPKLQPALSLAIAAVGLVWFCQRV